MGFEKYTLQKILVATKYTQLKIYHLKKKIFEKVDAYGYVYEIINGKLGTSILRRA